jgi:hypothetical protein
MPSRLRLFGPLCLALLLCCAPGHPATAKSRGPSAELTDGFRLGKFATTAKLLAADLYYIQSLAGEFAVGKEDVVGSDPNNTDFALAGSALTYGIWRVKLSVLPVCEDGLKSAELDQPVLKDYSQPLKDLLTSLKTDCNGFIDGVQQGDPQALTAFVGRLKTADYVSRLLDLADKATAAAGDAPAK